MKRLFLILLIASACSDSDPNQTPVDKLPVNNTALFENAVSLNLSISDRVVNDKEQSVTFDVLSDSRCPSEVVCFWAGEVNVEITILESNGNKVVLELKAGDSEEVIIDDEKFNVKLVDVLPYPTTPGSIPPEDYRIVLEITPV